MHSILTLYNYINFIHLNYLLYKEGERVSLEVLVRILLSWVFKY